MTRFVYFTDSHFGAKPQRFQQQKPYTALLPEIVSALREFCEEKGDIDFALHGGDMVDFTSLRNIESAAQLFDFPVPHYLCLGNHDLTIPTALELWQQWAPQFFVEKNPVFSLHFNDCHIHVVPNHWEARPWLWQRQQQMHLRRDQLDYIEKALAAAPQLPHILLTHAPAFGLPQSQTGFEEPFHSPIESFSQTLDNLALKYPQLRCVLGAHNHLNMRIKRHQTQFVTASAIVEVPFEFKVFEVSEKHLSMSTVSLVGQISSCCDYNFNKTFVQGRGKDRGFVMDIGR